MRSAPRRLLAISYPFPPAAVVGVYRIVKYCKFLPACGWLPIVLTVPFPGSPHRDDALVDEVPPEVLVVRTVDPNLDGALSRLRRRIRRRRPGAPAAADARAARVASPGAERLRPRRLAAWFVRLLTESPDPQVFWIPFAVARGARLLVQNHIDVIYSTSPPHSSHLAGWCLAKVFRKPHVVDFRDPWEVGGAVPWLMHWLKRLVAKSAARVVTVSDGERLELLQEVSGLDPERVEVITNGYDPEDFLRLRPARRRDGTVTISHVGMIHRGAGGEFFDGLRLLVEERPEAAAGIHVTLVGAFDAEYRDSVERLEAAGLLSRAGLLPHKAALQTLVDSDVLAILLGGDRFSPSELPAKLPEYLYAGKPILAVAKPGELWDVLAKSRAGVAVPPHNPAAVAAALVGLAAGVRANDGAFHPDRQYIERFDRRALAARFARILDEVVSTRDGVAART